MNLWKCKVKNANEKFGAFISPQQLHTARLPIIIMQSLTLPNRIGAGRALPLRKDDMAERIKALLKELYPDSTPSVGVDFDKSGTVEDDETVRDFNGDGIVDDIDYGILTFNNRNSFIYHNGISRWNKVEEYWNDAAKKAGHVAAKGEPSILSNNNAGDEELQKRIINDKFDGETNLDPAQAQHIAATRKEMEELKERYPSVELKNIRPSDAGAVLAMMKKIENFNPNLTKHIDGVSYKIDDCSEESPLFAQIFLGGCADGQTVRINKWLTRATLNEDEAVVHEATHIYHGRIREDDGRKVNNAQRMLYSYISRNYRLPEKRKREVMFYEKPVNGEIRDIVEDNLAKRAAGNPYDKKVVELYENRKSAREGSFDYRWNHVNQKYMPDADYEEVESAGKNMEEEQRNFEALAVEAFGNDGKSPFWHDSFFGGGDRPQPIVKGRIEKMIDDCRDPSLRQRLDAARKDLDATAFKYRIALDQRQLSRTLSIEVDGESAGVVWKGVGPKEGLAAPYGATNGEEAVATFVQYVYANDKLHYKPFDERHNEMVKNYARLLVEKGFLDQNHPACRDVL